MKHQTQVTEHALYLRSLKEKDPLYHLRDTYYSIRKRCLNPRSKNFHQYGGRGVKLAEEWMDFHKFKEWALSAGWKKGLQIDRIDCNGDYTPINCRFVDSRTNNRNRRNNKLDVTKVAEIRRMLAEGKKGPEIARMFGIHHSLVYRIKLNQQWL